MNKSILTLFFAFILIFEMKAQNPAPPAQFELFSEIVNDTIGFSVDDLFLGNSSFINANKEYNLTASILLQDTVVVDSVFIGLGNALDSTNLLGQFYSIETNSINIQRDEMFLIIDLGVFTGYTSYFGKVYLKDENGNISIEKVNSVQ